MENKIGNYIKTLRKEKNMTINQLALYSEVSSAHISRIERGLRNPSPDVLNKLSNILNTSYEELLKTAGYLKEDYEDSTEVKEINEYQVNAIEIEKLLESYKILLDGHELDEIDKKLVVDFLKILKQRDQKKNQ